MNYVLSHTLSHFSTDPLSDILQARGVTKIGEYLRPTTEHELNPKGLLNIERGANLILDALRNNKRILFIVDADQDGYASSAILWLYCKKLYPESNLSFVTHEGKQHGLEDHVDWLEDGDDYDLVICPDSGSADYDYHKRLYDGGKRVLVLDHHQTVRDSEYAVVINNQLSPDYDNKSLCGAGVVYKFCQYLDTVTGNSFAPEFLDLVALAEIGDVMDLRPLETRYYVKQGLQNIHNFGLQSFLDKQSYSISNTARPTPTDVAFYVVPLVNAIVRVGSKEEKDLLFRAFLDGTPLVPSTKRGAGPNDTEVLATQVARLAENARSRQNRQKDKACEILEQRIIENDLLQNKILILEIYERDDIPQTLTGLIATYFINKYNRPALVVRKNKAGFLRGSARSSETFAIPNGFKHFLFYSGLMEYAEGHDNAFGVSLPSKHQDALIAYANENLREEMLTTNTYTVDYIFDGSENFSELGAELASGSDIWGNGVKEPLIVVEKIPIKAGDYFIQGKNKDSIKFSLNGIDFVRFKDLDFVEALKANKNVMLKVVGRFGENNYGGRISTQFIILDYELENWYNIF